MTHPDRSSGATCETTLMSPLELAGRVDANTKLAACLDRIACSAPLQSGQGTAALFGRESGNNGDKPRRSLDTFVR